MLEELHCGLFSLLEKAILQRFDTNSCANQRLHLTSEPKNLQTFVF